MAEGNLLPVGEGWGVENEHVELYHPETLSSAVSLKYTHIKFVGGLDLRQKPYDGLFVL